MNKGFELIDRMAAGGAVQSSDWSRLRNIMRNLQNLTLDWIKIYHNERQTVVQQNAELEAQYQSLAATIKELREKYE